ncbi:MAG: hypothetical protein WCX17_04635 [Parcubacteria group bacterium]|jgi:hypothetical protein
MKHQKNIIYFIGTVIIVLLFIAVVIFQKREIGSFSFVSNSDQAGTLQEAGSMKESKSSDWWLDSGGILNIGAQEFSTNAGPLPEDNKWRKLYNKNNPKDTDNGFFSQNIFRLVTKSKWQNLTQQVYFNIDKINLSQSENRIGANGVLLFNRYQNGSNLYYAGVRVDGDAVIKKKIDGKYYTMKEAPFLTKNSKYDRVDNPNLIPTNIWIGIRSVVTNIGNNTVYIRLYVDWEQNGNWQLLLEAKDREGAYGKDPFTKAGYAGIRTDFMDVKFKNYFIQED